MPGPLLPQRSYRGKMLQQMNFAAAAGPSGGRVAPNLGRRTLYRGGEHLDGDDAKSAATGAAGAAGTTALSAGSSATMASAKQAGAGLLESYQGYLNDALVWLGVQPVDLVKDPQLRDVVWAAAPFAALYVAVEHEKVANRARAYGVPVPQGL